MSSSLARKQRGADKYALYEAAVQCPEFEVDFCETAFERHFGRRARSLREDFCGTGAIACAWIASGKGRSAVGVDLDPEPLALAGERSQRELTAGQRQRLVLQLADARQVTTEPVDVVLAVNFSYFVFKERAALVQYFRAVRRALGDEGLFVLDIMGGPACQEEGHTTRRRLDGGAVYVWEHATFEPGTHHTTCRISFELPGDRQSLRAAFVYDWRLWTLPEVRECLAEAGFPELEVHWEIVDEETGEGTGHYAQHQSGEAMQSWTAYLVAIPEAGG